MAGDVHHARSRQSGEKSRLRRPLARENDRSWTRPLDPPGLFIGPDQSPKVTIRASIEGRITDDQHAPCDSTPRGLRLSGWRVDDRQALDERLAIRRPKGGEGHAAERSVRNHPDLPGGSQL